MKIALTIFLCFAATQDFVTAQVLNVRFSSSAYSWQKFDTVDVSKKILRAFQTLRLDVVQGDISVHSYLVGSMNFIDPVGGEGILRVFNTYVRWRNLANLLDVSVGRVPVFAGVGTGVVDGGLAKVRFWNNKSTLLMYGGANVRPNLVSTDYSELGDNLLIGAQFVGEFIENLRLGVSYVRRNFKKGDYIAIRPDSLFNPINIPISFDTRGEQIVGLDARYFGSGGVTGYGRYDYDLYSKRTLRGQLSSRVAVTEQVALTADFIYREPRIFYNSFFTVFPMSSVREYEGGAEYGLSPAYRVFGRFAYVQYTGDAGRRFSAGVYSDYGSVSYSGTNGYAGLLNSFHGQFAYPFLGRKIIPNLGLSYASYRLFADGSDKQNIYAAILGAIVRPEPSYSVSVHVQWLRNPVFSNDTRLFASVNYWFHRNLGLFE